MTALGRDFSNFSTDPPTTAGVEFGIVQALTPPMGKPHAMDGTHCLFQVKTLQAAGIPTDAYLFWQDGLEQTLAERIALLDTVSIRQWWVDFEVKIAGLIGAALTQSVADALAAADQAPSTLGRKAGFYTNQDWVNWYAGQGGDLSVFDGRPTWIANWSNGRADASDTKFGGNPCNIKQYAGTQPDGTDLDVMSDEEALLLNAPTVTPPPPTVTLDGALQAIAYMADTLGDSILTEVALLQKIEGDLTTIQQELQRVRTQYVGERPAA